MLLRVTWFPDFRKFYAERHLYLAVVSATEQFGGVEYARYSLASWRAAQFDCYRSSVWRVLTDPILRRQIARGGDLHLLTRFLRGR